jgi:hypothetical protein
MNWRPVEEKPRRRPRIRWEDQIHENVRRIGIGDRSRTGRPRQKAFEKLGNTTEYRRDPEERRPTRTDSPQEKQNRKTPQ